jgi:hypothetical protein
MAAEIAREAKNPRLQIVLVYTCEQCAVFPRRVGMSVSGIEFHRLWIEQCAAAERIKQRFGLGNALEYLVDEKLLRFVETAEHNPLFAQSSRLSLPK